MSIEIRGPVRVRFAPSPTGFLHLGGVRTAIYNDLLRQNAGGAFILRIEDTDKERSDEAMTRQIQSTPWPGSAWSGTRVRSSERAAAAPPRAGRGAARRRQCLPLLLHPGGAGPPSAPRRRPRASPSATRAPASTCSQEETRRPLAAGRPFAVRFQMPDDHIRFTDIVRGDMDFPPDALDDFILLRSDGTPTYHMSVVVDDIDMADHPRDPRRGPPLEHAEAHPALPGAGRRRCRPSATCR